MTCSRVFLLLIVYQRNIEYGFSPETRLGTTAVGTQAPETAGTKFGGPRVVGVMQKQPLRLGLRAISEG